jgi:hypothetical protein
MTEVMRNERELSVEMTKAMKLEDRREERMGGGIRIRFVLICEVWMRRRPMVGFDSRRDHEVLLASP